MATVGQILASTHRAFLDEVADNVLTGIPLLESLMQQNRVTYKGGRQIVEPILKALPSGGAYTGLDQFAATDNDELDAAVYEWMSYRAMPAISGMDSFKNSGDAEVISIWGTKMQAAGMKIREDLAAALFADAITWDSSLNITPLEAILDDNDTFTVGGLKATDVALWTGQTTVAGAAGALSTLMLETGCLNASEGYQRPTDIILSKAGYGKFWSLAQLLQRFRGSDKTVGFENFIFDTSKVYWDSHILTTGGSFTAQRAYILNANWLRVNIGEGANFVMEDKTPTNADGYVAQIKLYCQLSTNARRFQATVDNFTTT